MPSKIKIVPEFAAAESVEMAPKHFGVLLDNGVVEEPCRYGRGESFHRQIGTKWRVWLLQQK